MKRGGAWRAAGVLLLLVPLLPLRRIFGELERAQGYVPPGEWLLGTGVFAAVAWLLCLLPGMGERVDRAVDRMAGVVREAGGDAVGRRAGGALLALLAAILGVVAWDCLGHTPLLVDSVAQLFQARIFASGHVVAPAPVDEAFFAIQHTLVEGRRWYAQYPPGHPALLAVGALAGAPWLVGPVLSVGTAGLVFLLVRRIYGRSTALLTLGLLLVSPFFWFMGASFMNHTSALFFLALALWAFARWEAGPGRRGTALLAGLALGGAFLSRPLDAAAVGGVFAAFAAARVLRGSDREGLLAGVTGFAVVAALYPLFNAATTGDPLLPGYLRLWGESHGLGFHATPWGGTHTPAAGLRNELLDLALLNQFLFEWPVPALLPAGVGFAAGWLSRRWDRRLLVLFLAIPAAYSFYWHRDAFLGPRFLYPAAVLGAVPLTARALVEAARRLRGRSVRPVPGVRAVRVRPLAFLFVGLALAYALVYGIPARYRNYAGGMAGMRVDVAREARTAGLETGLVFVAVSWGNRLLAHLRGLGVPASLAERAYRGVDHCDLDALVGEARGEGWSGARTAEALRGLLERGGEEQLVTPNLNGDPTLRLRRGRRLPPRCVEELRYDREGYGLFTPYLPANRPDLGGPLVIARDLRAFNRVLRRAFPGRRAYLYRDGAFTGLPPVGGAPR